MSLHAAEAVALELAGVALFGLALYWACKGFRIKEDAPGRGETTQHSSTTDD